jgi:hypothetical protein
MSFYNYQNNIPITRYCMNRIKVVDVSKCTVRDIYCNNFIKNTYLEFERSRFLKV